MNPVYFQIIYPHLKWLRARRDEVSDQNDRMGANAGIVLFSAIFLEGFLEDALTTFAPHYSNGLGEKAKTLVNIERTSSLDGYKTLFESFGFELYSFLSSVDQEDLDFIFSFRNLLAHGQRDSYLILHDGDWMPKEIVGSFYQGIEKFLVKRRVLQTKASVQPLHSELFSDPVADWVYSRTMEISEEILGKLKTLVDMTRIVQQSNLDRISRFLDAVDKPLRKPPSLS